MKRLGTGAVIAATLALVATHDCWAGHHGGGRAHRSSGFSAARAVAGVPAPRPGLAGVRAVPATMPASIGQPRRHHHPGRAVIFIGAPYWYWAWPYGYAYLPPPYYYGPDYGAPKQEMPAIYIEKFDGTPTPETVGDIYCPGAAAYYPEVQDCPGGWQRIFREAEEITDVVRN